MANIKSQIKRIKTNQKATERNRAYKSELRTAIRRVRGAVAEGNAEKATAALQHASVKLDKAVSKGVLHKNQAKNRKSSIAKAVDSIAA
ncbi:30S ribosomal protein S20 [Pseudoclavibacter endophyticus]|uniref:Small ribosomal subunit protein bS20 n=1 Tax=Pseudoclavibacter endophyticus TaxID=1778590 RepID=A0A6H9WAV2_9MICO|nr:30S ribosomal protein S20 [Pseudoclavibacter endophyticus]KAB1646884.1 30S ribosomal protein S20 [Pseudoclavibacter endophyticus]GGA74722.1 30S ribosomal protein S20 [Pseudoclavibacter endophyticus]